MTPADLARKAAISLEAKKDALLQRQSGDWKISFTVQGDDMDSRLTKAAMGTRFAMVLVEIGDDELPVQNAAQPEPIQPPARAKRDKMDWRDMQPAAQAGIRCADPVFRSFLDEMHSCQAATPEEAATAVRMICNVESRSELITNHKARVIWKQLDDQFQAWKALEHA